MSAKGKASEGSEPSEAKSAQYQSQHFSASAGRGKAKNGRDEETADTQAAINFLRDFFGEAELWPLVAIKKVGKKSDLQGYPFTHPTKREEMVAEWVERWNARGYNIYFPINRLNIWKTKASKEDVATADWLWIDLDPRKGADPAAEQARLDRALGPDRPAEIPAPTWEIDSGRGRWGFWRLREPVPVDGKDCAATLRVEAHGRGIEQAFGKEFADSCRNIERIARLPGTINHNTGRRARVVAHRPEAQYDLRDFPFVDEPSKKANGHDNAASDEPHFGQLPHVNIDALPVSDRIRHMIRTGEDIEDPTPFASRRSERAFAVLIAMAAAGCDDPTMAAVMLDPALPIGAHIREQKDLRKYLVRQIAEARKYASSHAMANRSEMRTDLGNARRLVRAYGESLRYIHVWKSWVVWVGGRWRKDDNGSVMRMGKATIEEMFEEASEIDDESRRAAQRGYALQCQSAQRLDAMIKLAESEIEVILSVDKLDADPLLLGVPNGVVDLRNGTFREGRRDDYVTKCAGAAFHERAQCPQWRNFLKKIFDGDDDLSATCGESAGTS